MERAFGRNLPLATLFEAPTVEQLADLLSDEGLVPSWSALAPIQPQGSCPPLFCVHAADGQVLLYRDLARHLGPDQPLYGLQTVGMGGTEPPLPRIEEMAARYVEELRMVQPQGPYSLAGYCMGAFVALEMARQLQLSGQRVALLACIDTDARWRDVRSFRDSLRYHVQRLSRLGFEQSFSYVLSRIGYRMMRLRSTFLEIVCYLYRATGKRLPHRLLRAHVQELNHRAGVRYVPQVYRGQVTCFEGTADALADPLPFWQRIATGGVDVRFVPGRGTGVLQEPNVRHFSESLQSCLEKARTAQPGDL
jgi:aspartate racemase